MGRTVAGVERYTRVAVWLHWTIGTLILANLALGILHEAIPGSMAAHKPIGLIVLVLSLARLGWRLAHPAPPLPRDIPAWQRAASHVSHWAFYGFMVLMPLSGWIFTSAAEKRRPIVMFGGEVPFLPVPQDEAIGGPWHDAHVLMGWALLALVALHVAAALKHHFVDRDAVLARMATIVPLPRG